MVIGNSSKLSNHGLNHISKKLTKERELKTKPKKLPTKQEYIERTLRRGCYAWKPRTDALNASRVSRGVYRCFRCKAEVGRKEITMDHISSVNDPRGMANDWNGIVERMFCEFSGWMALCIDCHQIKSNMENECRRTIKGAIAKLEKDLKEYYERHIKD